MSLLTLHPEREARFRPLASNADHASSTWLLAGVLGLGVFFASYGLSAGALYRNEGLRALVAAETLRTGHWLVPTLHGEPFLTKPPGMTLAIAGASWPLGRVTESSARLPSVMAALATLLAFYGYFRQQLGARAGLVAAAILPASLLWLDRTPSAEIDMLQLAWVTAAILCFLRALEIAETEGDRTKEWRWWQAALLCVAGGFLTKWTAPAFFYLTVVPLLAWRGRLRLLVRWPHLVSVVVAAVPCFGWALTAAAVAGWDTLIETVRREALLRLSPAQHPRSYPWGELLEFPATFLAANLPWSAFAAILLLPWFARLGNERERRLVQALQCWLWVNLLFWTLVPGHRPRHCLPLQPAVAGLAALVWLPWLDGRLSWRLPGCRPRFVLGVLLALFVVVKLAYVHIYIPLRDSEHGLREKGAALAREVPPGQTIYLRQLKEDGLLFYAGRPTCRLPCESLPDDAGPIYALLTMDEWRGRFLEKSVDSTSILEGGQGAQLVLVKRP